jgi:hypothetical protein
MQGTKPLKTCTNHSLSLLTIRSIQSASGQADIGRHDKEHETRQLAYCLKASVDTGMCSVTHTMHVMTMWDNGMLSDATMGMDDDVKGTM